MLVYICFFLAAAVIAGGTLFAMMIIKMYSKRKYGITSFGIFFYGIALAAIILFVPVYAKIFEGESFMKSKSILLSIHNTIRLFIVDGEFTIISDFVKDLSGWINPAYSMFMAVIFVIAPFLTFGVVLSFLKRMLSYQYYMRGYFEDAFVFSELNEKSLAIAESLKKNNCNRLIAFTDVYMQEEESYELKERAEQLGAICFKKDILFINFNRHSKKRRISFFVIGKDKLENIQHAMKIAKKYGKRSNTYLYLFSPGVESELALSTLEKGEIKIRRVHEEQSLINRMLYEEGQKLFENACTINEEEKLIKAVIVGMGTYGTHLIKSLVWYCQMDGWQLQVEAFDQDPLAEERFSASCPELMSDKYNGVYREGEAYYSVRIHAGIDYDTKTFMDEIQRLQQVTYAFVAAGTDEENIQTAVNLRMLFERMGIKPMIQAVVRNSVVKEALYDIKNYRGQQYEIAFIGDIKSSYSEEVILDSELEADALARHLKWGEEEEFWKYEYNYCSSVAAAIHAKAKIACQIPGVEKTPEERTTQERDQIEQLEHLRWNAYMRSQGYVYSGSPEKSSRNELGKMHHNLVEFSLLTEEDKRKDS